MAPIKWPIVIGTTAWICKRGRKWLIYKNLNRILNIKLSMNPKYQYDIFVIGGGSGGLTVVDEA